MSDFAPRARLVAYLRDAEQLIASAAKLTISPKDLEEIMEDMGEERASAWIRELISRGHGSPLEHSIYIFEIVCSRACSHQLVRHRHASYSQLSQRYSDKYLRSLVYRACEAMGKECRGEFGFELAHRALSSAADIGDFEALLGIASEAFIVPPRALERRDADFLKSLLRSAAEYYRALANGIPFEDARYLLPQAAKTKLLVSMNARELSEVFLPLRMCSRAQWEIRAIAWQMRSQLAEVHPRIFAYVGPRCVLNENRAGEGVAALEDYLKGDKGFTIRKCPEGVLREKISDCLRAASPLRS